MNTPPPNSSGTSGRESSKLRDDARNTVRHARAGAAGRADALADSLDAAAGQLEDDDLTRMSGYVHDMAESLGGFARDLREKSGDEVLRDVQSLARDNPALFLGGSLAIGFGLSRFARATRSRDRKLPVPLDEARAAVAPRPGTPTGGAA